MMFFLKVNVRSCRNIGLYEKCKNQSSINGNDECFKVKKALIHLYRIFCSFTFALLILQLRHHFPEQLTTWFFFDKITSFCHG